MAARDLASNLEFWSGRNRPSGAGEDPPRRPRRGFGRFGWSLPAAPRGRARPVAAALLLAALTAAWLVAGHASRSSGAIPVGSAAATGTTANVVAPANPPSTSVSSTSLSPTTVPHTPDCSGLSAARVEVRCVIDAVTLDVRWFVPGAVTAAYEHATGVRPVPGSGPAACARGGAEERSWSVAATPVAAVGRYLCRFENGRAAMWWTYGDRLVHAVGPGADLAGLFSWWRAHPSE